MAENKLLFSKTRPFVVKALERAIRQEMEKKSPKKATESRGDYANKNNHLLGKIVLLRLSGKKVIPALVFEEDQKGFVTVAQIKPFTTKKEKNVVDIGEVKGLRSHSVVMAYRVYKESQSSIIKKIATVGLEKVNETKQLSEKFISHKKLHEELREIKKKINLAQFNNEDYREEQKRLYEILDELGYPIKDTTGERRGLFPLAPTKGPIKIYYGGRCK